MSSDKIQEWGWDEFEESMKPEIGAGFVKKEDHLRILQSTRQALADTKAQLEALEDAIARLSDLDQKSEELEVYIQSTLRNAVANSRARKQG